MVGYEAAVGLVDWKVGTPIVNIGSQVRTSVGKEINFFFQINFLGQSTSVMEIHIPVKRKYAYYIPRVFLILFMIVAISWSTFSLEPSDFADRMSINVTLLLAAVE